VADFMAANPESLMFGTDLPSTRAPRPFDPQDLALIRDSFEEADAERILYSNAARFYGAAQPRPREAGP
jgi:predicted TIM-barrel fold metal-dependent hydrolase